MYAIVHEEMLEGLKHLDDDTQAKIVMAYVNYQIYGVEPSKDDVLVYSVFKAKQFDLDATKSRAEVARENGKKGGRPRKDLSVWNKSKTKKTQTKPNHNQKEPNNNQTITQENPEKPIEIEIDNINRNITNSNIILSNNTESKDSESITIKINELITELKDLSNSYGVAYESKNERNFAKHILTAKEFGDFAEKIGQSRTEFAKNILKASVLIKYWKGVCSGPMMIYQNYAEVYNKAVQESLKKQKSSIPSF